jgi:hypothetical protein
MTQMDSDPSILVKYARISLDNPLAVQEVRGTGPIIWVPELSGWRINPSTTFPLTVVKADLPTARRIRQALDGLVDHYRDDVVEAIAAVVTERQARFYEFEAYLEGQRRVYQEALAATLAKGVDTESREEIEDAASDALDNCCQEIFELLEGRYPDGPEELSLIGRFGYANLLRYLRIGPNTVKLVSPTHRNRPGFESLVRSGLALAGDHIAEIPTSALLNALTNDDLRRISTNPIPSKSRKKNLAVEFLLTQKGIRDRTLAAIKSAYVFYTLPVCPELHATDLGNLRNALEFAWSATALVVDTYLAAALASTNRGYEGQQLSSERYKAQSINNILTCRSCQKLSGTCRALADWDRFPFHFGCRCFLLIEV